MHISWTRSSVQSFAHQLINFLLLDDGPWKTSPAAKELGEPAR